MNIPNGRAHHRRAPRPPRAARTNRRNLAGLAVTWCLLLAGLAAAPTANALQNGELIYYEASVGCDPLTNTIYVSFNAGTTRDTNQRIYVANYLYNHTTGQGFWVENGSGGTNYFVFDDWRVKRFENSVGGGWIANDQPYTTSPQFSISVREEGQYELFSRHWWWDGSRWVPGGVWTTQYQNYYQSPFTNRYCWLND